MLLFLHFTKGELLWSTDKRKYTNKPASSWGDQGRKRFNSLVEQQKVNRNEYNQIFENDLSDDDEMEINIEREDCFNYLPSNSDSTASESATEDSTQDQIQQAMPIEV